jgi:hypothetical protein
MCFKELPSEILQQSGRLIVVLRRIGCDMSIGWMTAIVWDPGKIIERSTYCVHDGIDD